jgi:hypothetical protein
MRWLASPATTSRSRILSTSCGTASAQRLSTTAWRLSATSARRLDRLIRSRQSSADLVYQAYQSDIGGRA